MSGGGEYTGEQKKACFTAIEIARANRFDNDQLNYLILNSVSLAGQLQDQGVSLPGTIVVEGLKDALKEIRRNYSAEPAKMFFSLALATKDWMEIYPERKPKNFDEYLELLPLVYEAIYRV